MKLDNCTLDISNSGRILRISRDGETICELLIHGFLKRAMESTQIANGSRSETRYTYRGEVHQIAAYEYLNTRTEQIEERENE